MCWFMAGGASAGGATNLVERGFRPVNQKSDEIVSNFNVPDLRPGRRDIGAGDEGVDEELVLRQACGAEIAAARPASSPARRRRRPGTRRARDGPPAPPGARGRGGCRARRRVGDHRDVAEARVRRRPLFAAGRSRARTRCRAPQYSVMSRCDALVRHVLDDRLDRREAGAAGDEQDRLVAVAQREVAERHLDVEMVAAFSFSNTCGRERAVRHSRT